MKFRDVVETNRSPKIEGIVKLNDSHCILYTSDNVYMFNTDTNRIDQVDFKRD